MVFSSSIFSDSTLNSKLVGAVDSLFSSDDVIDGCSTLIEFTSSFVFWLSPFYIKND